jgi:hypothetical protein
MDNPESNSFERLPPFAGELKDHNTWTAQAPTGLTVTETFKLELEFFTREPGANLAISWPTDYSLRLSLGFTSLKYLCLGLKEALKFPREQGNPHRVFWAEREVFKLTHTALDPSDPHQPLLSKLRNFDVFTDSMPLGDIALKAWAVNEDTCALFLTTPRAGALLYDLERALSIMERTLRGLALF